MKSWLGNPINRSLAIITALLLLILSLYIGYAYKTYVGFQSEIDSLRPRIEKLKGLATYEQEFLNAATNASQSLDEMVLSNTVDLSSSKTQLQQNVRAIFDRAGMTVSGSQILPETEHGRFQMVNLDITVTGKLESLVGSLQELEQQRPLVMINSMTIQPVRVRKGEMPQQLTSRVRVAMLRTKNEA